MTYKRIGLNNNQLKIIAMIAMLIDHVGHIIYPEIAALRIVGRIAMPIFAYMIAEGCRHTHSRTRYLLMIFALGMGCQLAYVIAEGSLYQNILITFSIAIVVIFSIENFIKQKSVFTGIAMAVCVFLALYLCAGLPNHIYGLYFDYGVFGMLLIVAFYFARDKWLALLVAVPFLIAIALELKGHQMYALLAIPLIALYNGRRGKLKLKYLFYVFYPLHLGILWLIAMYT